MRFSTIIASGVVAALSVSAQSTNVTAVVSGTQSATPAQVSQSTCLAACPATDALCRDKCIVDPTAVPNPVAMCIDSCTQGKGSAAENEAYRQCQLNCRLATSSLVSSTVAPTGTGASDSSPTSGAASGSGSGSSGTASAGTKPSSSGSAGAVATGGSATTGGSTDGSATTSGSAAATSSSAADSTRVGAAGIFGIFAALLAL
ncbi:hypothetical protein BJ875DRAFT_501509 [Amylocarpus encephaloides]|uniref:Uncharacterized protein n=1 Tax=Amylocarpus encephaloides TaxID=45428 RepID=A0A9P8CBK5_9HELO|nr:hypothetical protein BJ875DRAFT_501509 [Amylocarpus encephaloides]